jgi:hypothetical protein
MTLELTERRSAIVLISLELREMYMPPDDTEDAKLLVGLIDEIKKKHQKTFSHEPKPRKKK